MFLIKTLKNPQTSLIIGVFFVLTLIFCISLFYKNSYSQIPIVHGASVTTTWIGGTTGNWSEAGNWDNGVPDATKNVLIVSSSASITVAVDANISFDSLTIG